MSKVIESQQATENSILHHPNIEEYIYIFLVAASFIGELIIKTSLLFGFFYWLLITPLFFIASILSEKVKTLRTGRETAHLIKYELVYWGSAFAAVILVVLLWDTERIEPSEASIFIHIILAHTMFLTGIVLGFRFYLIGFLLFATATFNITSQFSLSFGLDIVAIVFVTWLGLKVKNQFFLPIFKRETDFTKNSPNYQGEERRQS